MRPATATPPPRRGFTLVELSVTIGIIAALAAVVFTVGSSMVARSREAVCLGNLRGLGVALRGYLDDHNQTMPELEIGRALRGEDKPVLETVLIDYVAGGAEAFRCPADATEYARSGSSYIWNSTLSGRHVSKLSFFGIDDRPDRIPLISDKEAWHPGGSNFLYADLSSSSDIRFSTDN